MQILRVIWKYWSIYWRIFNQSLLALMEYRINFVLQLFYGPSYTIMLYLLLTTAFSKQPVIAGWTVDEAKIIFGTFHLIYIIGVMTFTNGIRHFLWQGLRLGELDNILTKPLNTQFLVNFSKPEIQHITLVIGLVIFLIKQLFWSEVTWSIARLPGYLILCILAYCLIYLSISTYAVIGFFVTKAQQVTEFFDKTTDLAQYPLPLFPTSIQIFFTTIIPTAFFGYFPTGYLLGKFDEKVILLSAVMVTIFYGFNRLAWAKGLKNYSSASS
jgi:ABC-2 type transport system permease protein